MYLMWCFVAPHKSGPSNDRRTPDTADRRMTKGLNSQQNLV